MKNRIFSALMLLVMVAPALTMCKKEAPQNTAPPVATGYSAEQKRVLEAVKQIKPTHTPGTAARPTESQVLGVCAADMMCFGVAMAILDEANWEPADIFMMGAAGAATGSLEQAMNPWITFKPSTYPNNHPYDDFNHQDYNNTNNVYDFIGEDHNTICDEANANFSAYWNGQGIEYVQLAEIARDKMNSVHNANITYYLPQNDFYAFYNLISGPYEHVGDRLDHMKDLGYDAYLCDMMKAFFANVPIGEEESVYVSYSRDVEAVVINSNLSDYYKKILLGSWSVGRYSLGYWSRVATK